jgi:hypothetical protein
MSRVQKLMRAAKRYNQLKAANLARAAAREAAAPKNLHDSHVVVFVATTANMTTGELLKAGLLWTRPEIYRMLIDAFGITPEADSGSLATRQALPTQD